MIIHIFLMSPRPDHGEAILKNLSIAPIKHLELQKNEGSIKYVISYFQMAKPISNDNFGITCISLFGNQNYSSLATLVEEIQSKEIPDVSIFIGLVSDGKTGLEADVSKEERHRFNFSLRWLKRFPPKLQNKAVRTYHGIAIIPDEPPQLNIEEIHTYLELNPLSYVYLNYCDMSSKEGFKKYLIALISNLKKYPELFDIVNKL